MTLIVGIIENGKVIIGGDSAGVSGLNITIRKDPKVFRVGEFIIGCTHSFRMMQLIRFKFTPPRRFDDTDLFEYMCTSFIDELRKVFKDGGFARKESDEESGGTFLVGYKGRMFKIETDYQVGEAQENYYACGCGVYYALGALDAMDENLPGIDKAKRALQIGVNRSGGVRPPFVIETT